MAAPPPTTTEEVAPFLTADNSLDVIVKLRSVNDEAQPVVAEGQSKFFFSSKTILDAFIVFSLIVVWTSNAVLFKKLTNAAPNYALFTNQFKVFVLFVFYVSLWMVERFVWKSVTSAMELAPHWPLILLGANDSIEGLIQTIGGIHTAGSLQVLLLQVLIPLTMIGSIIALGAKYDVVQYIGAAVIIIGVLVALWPTLFPFHPEYIVWNLVFLSCTALSAVGGIGKEAVFKRQNYTVGFFSSWTSSSQFITGWVVGPFMMWIPPNAHSISFFPSNLYDGYRCLLGKNSLPGDDCGVVPWLLPVNTVTNLLLTLLLVIMFKRFGAAFLYIVSTARLPLINIAFTFKWVMGKDAQEAGVYNYIGLVVIVSGLLCYRFGPAAQEKIVQLYQDRKKKNSCR